MLSTHHPKTLLVGAGFSGGGSETRLRMLGRHLFGGSADVAVFNSNLDLDRPGHARVFDLNWSGKASYPGVIVRLRRILQSGDYGAVMALGLYQNACLTAAAWGLRPRPVILLTETTQPHTNAMDGTSAVVFRLRDVLYRAIYPRADCVAANSMDGCQQIANRYGVPPEHIRRVPNIVDRDYITRLARDDAEFTEHDRPPAKICMVTRLEEMKHVDTLFLAAAKLAGCETEWTIDIVGDGPHKVQLETLVKRIGLQDRVHFLGWRSNPYPIMASSIATVSCSAYEGFSNTVLEAMSLGCPVITSLCSSDTKDMVARGAALGFDVGDADALSGHLRTILTDRETRRSLSRSADAYIADHTLDAAIETYEALIRDSINASRGEMWTSSHG